MAHDVFVLTASEIEGYRWYQVESSLSPLDEYGVTSPPGWGLMEPALRSGRCCMAIAATHEQISTAVSGIESARLRNGRNVRDTFVFVNAGTQLTVLQKQIALNILNADDGTGRPLQELSDAIGFDTAAPYGVVFDAGRFATALRALETKAPPATAVTSEASPAANVLQDTPRSRTMMADAISAFSRASSPGLLFGLSYGAVPATLANATIALTTHRTAPGLGVSDGPEVECAPASSDERTPQGSVQQSYPVRSTGDRGRPRPAEEQGLFIRLIRAPVRLIRFMLGGR